jgi:hypothetical protein
MIRDVRVLALCLLPLSACGTTKEIGQLDESSSDGDDSASDPTLTESDTTPMCGFESSSGGSNCIHESSGDEGEGDGTDESDDGGTGGSDDDGGDTDGCAPSVCQVPPDGLTEAEFVIDGDPDPAGDVSDLELPCTIESVEGKAPVTVTLSCTVGDEIVVHTIEANVPTTLNLVAGHQVVFSHFVWQPFWSEEWFSLRWNALDVDPLLMAGIRGGTLLPQPIEQGLVLLSEPFYGNVEMAVDDDVCELEPLCGDACAQERRHAISVSTGNQEALVYDGHTQIVGELNSVEIRVATAKSLENVQCEDVPSTVYSVLVVNTTEG